MNKKDVALQKVIDVIKSCKTNEQLTGAKKMSHNFHIMYPGILSRIFGYARSDVPISYESVYGKLWTLIKFQNDKIKHINKIDSLTST